MPDRTQTQPQARATAETHGTGNAAAQGDQERISAPTISLPKGGGAIRGMGEKFAANPVTGTGSMTVPISTSPGRSGFGPQLSLSYDSGAGSGPFGFGWSLSLPSITRKTDKGLPQYQDAADSDVFILSSAEDLVPALVQGDGEWRRQTHERPVGGKIYRIQAYRPRIEGLFARIERWTNLAERGGTFWRSISRDNVTTWYGKTADSRIADPADPTRIFSWLICESYDDKGNVIAYGYQEENSDAIDLSQAHERNRTEQTRAANRYLKRIKYGNRTPYYPTFEENQPLPTLPSEWLFEAVFDYGEHDPHVPMPEESDKIWPRRTDPFSSYRAGFEVRTYRLCQRVLMFHHFPNEQDVGANCLVRSTDFTYAYEEDPTSAQTPIISFLLSVSQAGYKRQEDGYLKKSLPSLEFEYSQPTVDETIGEVDPDSLENLPYGLDGGQYQWVDLDGEGLSGVLTEQAEGWFYKPNLSPINTRHEDGKEIIAPRFGPVERVAQKPSLAAISDGRQQLLDLAGDGQLDLVELRGPTPGFYERTHDEGWEPFAPFESLPVLDWDNPNLRFVDLTGDGHADIFVTEDDAFCWHPSLAEAGFGPPERVRQALDEEKGPKLVFADGTQSIYLADMSGDGLSDLVRIRNGEVSYWPNLGYGRFGTRVTMDNAPWFDAPDQFDQRRIRIADIDGSGATDVIYLTRDGVRLYFNQSGNAWNEPRHLSAFPQIDNLTAVTTADLLGNGTACLVWSSPLPGDARQPMRYIDLMGGQKPHLLVRTVNNLGAETRVHYAPSTKFYLEDELAGRPWITRLPFPVHVVERTETFDRISRNRFVTRYAYHHGYFAGIEREFRGFGMVEQFDTEEFATLSESDGFPTAENIDATSHVPPVRTKTWFHTGIYLGRDHVSNFFAGLLGAEDEGEYYREPGLTDAQARQLLLDDTVLPAGLTTEEEREACRALKGAMLRQEVYALDGTERAGTPYTVAEQNFTIRREQPRNGNRHAVFFIHPRETISYHYERDPAEPRLSHALTLEVDDTGNVLKSLAIGYGRRQSSLPEQRDRDKQTTTLITYTEGGYTNAIDDPDNYRTPLAAEARTYELTGFKPANAGARFSFDEWSRDGFALLAGAVEVPYEQTADGSIPQKRLLEHARTVYRKDDLSALLPLRVLELLALPGESYKLALTPGLLAHVLKRKQSGQPDEDLLPDPGPLLEGEGEDEGGYVAMAGDWWIPSGRAFFDPDADVTNPALTAALELDTARQHFYLPRKVADAFGQGTVVDYDGPVEPSAPRYDLLVTRTSDALGNTVMAANDYRVLQPRLVTDPNRNRAAAAFDVLGMVVATAVMGKEGQDLGDLLEGVDADPSLASLQAFIAHPQDQAASLLGKASTRIVYDLERYRRAGQPPLAAALARETHFHDRGGDQTRIQISFSYSDGFGREMQRKIQAEPSAAPQREPDVLLPGGDIRPGELVRDAEGKPVPADTPRRWVGSGRTVFNNKGKPIRQYEPFFSVTHLYEAERDMTDTGVSPVLFYDPVGRVVATLHPNHTWEKVLFDPWRQESWDVSDTVLVGDPKTDPDVGDFFRRLAGAEYLPTWHAQREGGALGPDEQTAAVKAAIHAATPALAHADSLGRTFLTVAHNRFKYSNTPAADPPTEEFHHTRVELDIEGNQRAVIDANDRVVMRYDYDLLGTRIHQASMEAGERWMLGDVAGNPIRAWDSRNHQFRTTYDPLRRPTDSFMLEGADAELLVGRSVYGETRPNPEASNLRGKLVQLFDQAGVVTSDNYDFKGNLLGSQRQLAQAYRATLNWPTVLLEDDTFTSQTTYDALNRPTELTTPDSSVIRPGYNEANLLEHLEVNLRGAAVATPFVTNIDYDAKGQRTLIDYATRDGKRISTSYQYDSETFRLIHLYTRRGVDPASRQGVTFTDDCDNPQPPPPTIAAPENPPDGQSCGLQNLHYTYDPAGNITHIRDDAQQTIFFKNQRVKPSADYTYDAINRLIEATGREQLGQAGGTPIPHSYNDKPRVGILFSASDGTAMGRYIERYLYDTVGNFLEMIHRGTDPAHPGWTRTYAYEEESLLEPGKESNRLSSATVGNGNPITEQYGYDVHGNMLRMPHLQVMQWDFGDHLQTTRRQAVNEDDEEGVQHRGERTWYVYDAGGQRVRKVSERQAAAGQTPTRMKERIYLGGFEIYRDYESDGETVKLERETLQVMDDKQRIALVETRTLDAAGNDPAPPQLIRYQLSNHLGSASLELDDEAQIISYEEYTPYGSTSYQAVRSKAEAPKRYRYTGMERDEESGLNYHGARYYAHWLGRWTVVDPSGLADGLNIYQYARNNPVALADPGGTDSEETPPRIARLPDERGSWTSTDLSLVAEEGPFTIETSSSRPEYDLYGQETGYDIVSNRTVSGIARRTADGWSYEDLLTVHSVWKIWSDIELPPPAKPDFTVNLPEKKDLPLIRNTRSATSVYRPLKAETKGWYSSALDWVQSGLDASSLALDATGVGGLVSWIPDVLNAGISAGRGDWLGSGLSLAAAIPFMGMAANTTRLGRSAAKAADVGPYRTAGGHHIHQSASYSPGGVSATGNPNHYRAISIEQGVPGFTTKQHDLASAAQRNINRGLRGKAIKQPIVGTLRIQATGAGKHVTFSSWFEDIKAFYSLLAARFSGDAALELTRRSGAQLDAVGAVPLRVPSR